MYQISNTLHVPSAKAPPHVSHFRCDVTGTSKIRVVGEGISGVKLGVRPAAQGDAWSLESVSRSSTSHLSHRHQKYSIRPQHVRCIVHHSASTSTVVVTSLSLCSLLTNDEPGTPVLKDQNCLSLHLLLLIAFCSMQ